jgi:hypothetical protein
MEINMNIIKNFKNITIAVFVILLIIAGIKIYKDYTTKTRLHEDLIGQSEAYEQLSKKHAKLAIEYKTQEDLLKNKDERWSEVVKEKNERIKLLSDATFLIGKHYLKSQGPDYFFETPKKTRNYIFNEVRIAGVDSPPIGFVMIKNDGRTYKGTYPFTIKVENLQTIDEETGKIKVYAKAFLISKSNGLAGKRRPDLKKWVDLSYPLDITGGTVLVDPTIKNTTSPRFFLNPKVDLTISAGLDMSFRLLPGLDVSLLSYGVSKNDSRFKFVGLGANFGAEVDDLDVNFKPIYWRPFSFFSNTYIYPGIGYSRNGVRYLLGIGVEL